jgi:hypothetical protein
MILIIFSLGRMGAETPDKGVFSFSGKSCDNLHAFSKEADNTLICFNSKCS